MSRFLLHFDLKLIDTVWIVETDRDVVLSTLKLR